jgi:hypothetical protein
VQWEFSTDHGASFSNINGATSTTLTLNNVTAAMNGSEYEAVFSNGIGAAATSLAATLTVDFAPRVTTNPTPQTATVENTATFTASASGNPPPSVQWEVSTDHGATFSNINGATSATLTLTNVTHAMSNNEYEAVSTNSINSAISSAVTLTVSSTPIVTPNTPSLAATATTLTINGSGFDTNATNDVVTFSGGVKGTVTSATATQLLGLFGLADVLGRLGSGIRRWRPCPPFAAACDAMNGVFDLVDICGEVVIGEGAKDNAPGLFLGDQLCTWKPGSPCFDVAVDPIDGTTNLASGLPNSISVMAASQRRPGGPAAMRSIPTI